VSLEEEIAIHNFLVDPDLVVPKRFKNRLQTDIIFQLAIETALRFSEVVALKKEEIYLDDGYLMVTGIEPNAGKSRAAIRSVPLTPKAKTLLSNAIQMANHEIFVFKITHTTVTDLLRYCFKKLNIVDLHFHDTRHEAISRLAKIYGILDLAKIVGHSSVEYLLTYFQPTIHELVEKMNQSDKNYAG
jgi:integrase